MPRNEQDPAASTQQFRAFARSGESARQGANTGLIVTLAAGVVIVLAVVAILLVG